MLGGTGKVGRRVVERLQASGLPVRVGSRSGTPPFDWEDRSTWARCCKGWGRPMWPTPRPRLPGRGGDRRLGRGAGGEERRPPARALGRSPEEEGEHAEQAVRDPGAERTILRSTWFAQNFSEDYWAESIMSGEVALPAGDTPEPLVDADDIADIAVAVLTDDRHIGELYELTGPRLPTFAEAVEEIARAVGRSIRYAPVSIEEFATGTAVQGLPGDVIQLLIYLFGEVRDGRNAYLADGVQRALGREPRDFRDYAGAAAASGAWDLAQVKP